MNRLYIEPFVDVLGASLGPLEIDLDIGTVSVLELDALSSDRRPEALLLPLVRLLLLLLLLLLQHSIHQRRAPEPAPSGLDVGMSQHLGCVWQVL